MINFFVNYYTLFNLANFCQSSDIEVPSILSRND